MPRTYRPPASRAREPQDPKSVKRSVPTLPRTSAASGVPAPTAQRLRPTFTRVALARTVEIFLALPSLPTTICRTTGAAALAGAAATSELAAAATSAVMRLPDTDHERVGADRAPALRLDEQ